MTAVAAESFAAQPKANGPRRAIFFHPRDQSSEMAIGVLSAMLPNSAKMLGSIVVFKNRTEPSAMP